MQNYLVATGDADGVELVNGTVRGKCFEESWFCLFSCWLILKISCFSPNSVSLGSSAIVKVPEQVGTQNPARFPGSQERVPKQGSQEEVPKQGSKEQVPKQGSQEVVILMMV